MTDEAAGTPSASLIALRERVKELAALHEVARLVQHDHLDLCLLTEQIARLIPPAFLDPEQTAACVRHGGLTSSTPNYRQTRWMLSGVYTTRAGVAGGIDVAYLGDELPAGSPFLEEERRLLDSLTEMLRLAAQRRESDAEIADQKVALTAALTDSRAERDHIALLLKVTNAMSSTLDLRTLITKISDLLRDTVPHLMANMALWDEDAGALRRVGVIMPGGGPPPAHLGEGSIVERGWPGDVVFRRGETTLFDDAMPEDLPAELLHTARPMGMRCGCGVPLQTARGRIGALLMGSNKPGPFPDAERRLLEQVAPQLAIAIENAQQFDRAERFRREAAAGRDRLQLLLELTNAVNSELSLPALLPTISELLRAKVRHHYASITLWDSNAGRLRRQALVFPTSRHIIQESEFVEPGAPPTRAFNAGRTGVYRWKDIEAIGGRTVEIMEAEGLRSGVCILLQTPRARLGTLNVAKPVDEDFPEDELRLLEQIGQQLAIAIENAMHFDDAERFRREAAAGRDRVQSLLDVNNAIVTHLDPHVLRQSVFNALRRAIAHDFAGLSLIDRESGELRLAAVTLHDERGVLEPNTVVQLDRTPTGLAFSTRQTHVFDAVAMRAMAHDLPHFPDGTIHACSVPLLTSRGAVGAFALGRASATPFSPADLELLNEVAGQVAIAVENTNAYGEIAALKDRLTEEKTYLQDELTEHADFAGIIGHSAGLREVLHNVRTVAPTDATVLLLGETGTGKEVIARSIHGTSRRRDQTFVRVNAAAVPAALFESELFGYERGAFTGAVASKIGRLELAHRGTLFLDEIGDLPIDLQPKLLRALQEHEFERLGSTRTQKIDVRLVAATNHDLEKMVEAGTFRSDLFYRLSVFPIRLPPLRDRREDIQPLVWHFVRKFSTELGRRITAIPVGAMTRLMNWDWPGNIRELQNVIERAVILSPGPSLDVPESAFQSRAPAAPAPVSRSPGTFQDGEREIILRALREANGIVGGAQGAAAKLGLKRTTLAAKMKKLGIARPTY